MDQVQRQRDQIQAVNAQRFEAESLITTKKKKLAAKQGLIIITATLVLTYLIFAFLKVPFLWAGLLYSVALGYLAFATKGSSGRAVYFNLAVLFLTFSAFEGYLFLKNKPNRHFEGTYSQKGTYFNPVPDDILGYVPHKNISVESRNYYKDRLLYDVVYTIDQNGLRVQSPLGAGHTDRCAIFFGGSFTFGEGVNDDATLPYRLGQKLQGAYRVYNFGFHGYGPHQMLSALESGFAQSVADCEAEHVFYQAITSHVSRSSGLAMWDLHGPRYRLSANGVERDGKLFESYDLPLSLINFLRRSITFRTVLKKLHGDVGDKEVELFLGIVDQSRTVVNELYPKAEFHVILWPPARRSQVDIYEDLVEKIRGKNLDLILVTDMLPGIDERSGEKEFRIANDGHPNSKAHDRIASYLTEAVFDQ